MKKISIQEYREKHSKKINKQHKLQKTIARSHLIQEPLHNDLHKEIKKLSLELSENKKIIEEKNLIIEKLNEKKENKVVLSEDELLFSSSSDIPMYMNNVNCSCKTPYFRYIHRKVDFCCSQYNILGYKLNIPVMGNYTQYNSLPLSKSPEKQLLLMLSDKYPSITNYVIFRDFEDGRITEKKINIIPENLIYFNFPKLMKYSKTLFCISSIIVNTSRVINEYKLFVYPSKYPLLDEIIRFEMAKTQYSN